MSPKKCPKCGKQGACTDSRSQDDYVRRRYRCRDKSCSGSWTTAEFLVHEGAQQRPYAVRDALARRANERAVDQFDRIVSAVRQAFK